MRSRQLRPSSDAPGATPWWAVTSAVAVATVGLGVVVLRPWQGSVSVAARDAWILLQQVGLMVLFMMTWVAPQLSGRRHRFAARVAAAGLALQLTSSLWVNQLAPGLGLRADTVLIGRTILAGLGGGCLILLVTSLSRPGSRHTGRDRGAILDSAVVGVAAAVVTWESLAVQVVDGRLAVTAAAAASATAAAAAATIVMLMLSAAWRLGAIRLLAVLLVLSMMVVLRFASGGIAHDPALDGVWELVTLLLYGTIAAAIVHPSLHHLVDDDGAAAPPPPHDVARAVTVAPPTLHGVVRAVTVATAVIAPSAGLLIRALTAAHNGANDWPIAVSLPAAVAGVLITLGVAWRLTQLVRERDEAHRLLRQRSLHDDLTGLPNRAHLLDGLKQQIERVRAHGANTDTGFGLMLLDLDGFRSINDTYGHDAGDAVLVDVAHRLVDTVRTDDFVGRMAGNEFVLLCGQPSDEQSLHLLAERLREAVEAPLPADFGVVTPQVSIAICAVDPDTAAARDAVGIILRQADARMLEAKSASFVAADTGLPRDDRDRGSQQHSTATTAADEPTASAAERPT